MINFAQVSKRYPGGYEALKQVDFSLKKGEMAFITGHSGAGKSTLLKLIAGLEKPSSGQIRVQNTVVNALSSTQLSLHRQRLGITFQSPTLLNDRSVFENVALPLRIQAYHGSALIKRVCAALDRVGLLNKKDLNPLQLSVGQQQRVGIARAVVHKPDLVLADEPTGNLDPQLSSEILRLFVQLNQAGVSIVIATHDLELIASMPNRILMLRQGTLC